MSAEWSWLCKTHLEEAEKGGYIEEKDTDLIGMETYYCDVSGCKESVASFVKALPDFWNKEANP